MRFLVRVATSASLILAVAGPVAGQKVVPVPANPAAPTIDGIITPAEMNPAAQTSMTLVGGFEKPKNATDAFMAMTPAGFHIAFRCAESQPETIITKAKKANGAVFMDDSVELFLCPNKESSKTNYFHFAVNAAGVPYSNVIATDRPVPTWHYAAAKTAEGWNAELLIPLTSVGAIPGQTHWRLNMARNRPARGQEAQETSAWVDPGTTFHNYRKFGYAMLAPSVSAATAQASGAAALGGTMAGTVGGSAMTTGTGIMSAATPSTSAGGSNVTTATTAAPAGAITVSTAALSTSTARATSAPAAGTTHTMITTGTSAIYR